MSKNTKSLLSGVAFRGAVTIFDREDKVKLRINV